MEFLVQHIEALIFTATEAIPLHEIQNILNATFQTAFKEEQILESIEILKTRYRRSEFAFEVIELAQGFQFLTKPAYHAAVNTLLRQSSKKKLSQATLETLAIVAYKQPITKTEIENIRGVACDYAIQKLLEKELISITGRSEQVGKPLLYGASEKFMAYFGIKDMRDLPKLKDFKVFENVIGEFENS